MTPTLTRPRPAQEARAGRLLVAAGIAAIVAIGVVLGPGVHTRSVVQRLSVTNPSPYSLQIDITGVDHDGWLNLGTVGRDSGREFREVLDQGSTWVVRFRSGGHDAGEVVVTRADLERNGWELQVPQEVSERLMEANVAPSVR